MTTYRLMDGVAGRPGTGSSGTQPPAAGTSLSDPYGAGNVFGVSQGGLWFQGYWWFICASNQDTAPSGGFKFCLYQVIGNNGFLVPGTTVTAASLSTGWNFVPLGTPIQLTPAGLSSASTFGAVYEACIGYTAATGFPDTQHQFGSGNLYSAGVTNGPLFMFSSVTGSLGAGGSSDWIAQSPFTVSGADPTVNRPAANDADDLLWLDVQVTDTSPGGVQTYRGYPNMPSANSTGGGNQDLAYTLGVEFSLSQACALERIWHYSPSGATVLPTRCGIWDVTSQTEVAGTDNSSPSWSGAAGSGWVSCDYTSSGVVLNASQHYKVSTFTSDNTDIWFLAVPGFYGTGDPFPSGITWGPLNYLGNAASTQGQGSWNLGGTWTYPATSTNPEFDGVDVEVLPQPAPPAVSQPPFAYVMRRV